MWRLIARDRDGREVARVHVAPPTGEIVVGRDPDAQVQLPSVGVSRRHARIAVDGDHLIIFDEGSANGVVVEGRRIARSAELRAGSLVQIAEFLIEVDFAPPSEVLVPTGPERWRLLCTHGPLSGREFNLPRSGGVVGRGPGVDLVIDDPSISRRHARFQPVDGALQVEDLGSQNGTFVAGARVERARIEERQPLRLGDITFTIERGAGSSTAYVGPAALRRGLLWAGAAAALAGTVLLILSAVRKPQPAAHDSMERLTADVDEHTERARLAISRRQWAAAADELRQALARDPLAIDARTLERRVTQEQKTEKLMLRAAEALAHGGAEDLARARALYREVPDGSAYRREADEKRADVEKRLPALLAREVERECAHEESTPRCRALVCAAASLRDPASMRLRRRFGSVSCP